MSDLFEHFQQTIHHKNILIAFSGGLDSTALLSLFAKLHKNQPHLTLRAIHIHHGLSPNANGWVAHCEEICHQFNIPLIVEKVRVNTQNGIEAGAREARYQAIAKHIQINEILATAHHLNDQTETFLLALKRGSGLQGLSAMQKENTTFGIPILRPLLSFSRKQLEQYVQAQNLSWIEDESNLDNQYDRNFLRNEILPSIRKRWQHFDQAVQRSAQHCGEQQQLINELLEEDFQKNFSESDRTFNIACFTQYSQLKQKALLRLWLNSLEIPMPSTVQLTQLIQDVIFAKQDANPQFVIAGKIIRRYQNKLFITDKFADLSHIILQLTLDQKLALPDGLGEILAQQRNNKIYIKWQQYEIDLPFTEQPIEIRFSYSGKVKLHSKAMNQEIKKIWQQLNVPPWQRKRIPLIFYGNQLKSAVGFFKILSDDA
ncbi:tRNA lysidine(34) synthetase TilS [Mannheimia massilioguelmaensis]|uniref:tRNA lysidine(34) synthetase TilS n=1 Tax=Mannheimia massilioguelmaensis TaxID=1604354 RepID=UPI0005C95D4E|nr:tRNA lysidine(34) synthetase TilS [Mannheimia massilioguelmaensis]